MNSKSYGKKQESLRAAAAWISRNAGEIGEGSAALAVSLLLEKIKEGEAPLKSQVRKTAVILFADVVGFTSLSESLDPEFVTELINALWEGIDLIVVKWGGTIDKHIGDAVMALWGDYVTQEDDVERSVQCALDMLEWLRVFNSSFRFSDGSPMALPLSLRVGIHSGMVLIGPIGTIGERSAIGDAVNTAARIQTAAKPGSVLVTEPVFRSVSGIFDFEDAGFIEMKGKAEPIAAYAATKVKNRPDRGESRGIDGIIVPMVGRQKELARLREAFSALRQEAARIILVGEAGIGKSRLLREFLDELELRPERIPLFRGRCVPGTMRETHSILKSIFIQRFRMLETDSVEDTKRKFAEEFSSVLRSAGAQDEAAEHKSRTVAAFLGFSDEASGYDDPKILAAKAIDAIVDFFAAIPSSSTLVVIEDLHWADAGSLADIERIFREPKLAKTVVVTTSRPSDDETLRLFMDKFPSKNSFINLEPLDSHSSLTLAKAVFKGFPVLPLEIISMVEQKAEGVPYFVEELARMLFDIGVVDRRNTPWKFDRQKLSKAQVPGTLSGLLQARIDALSKGEREVLLAASVIGRTFWDSAAASISRKQPKTTRPILEILAAKELVFPKKTSTFLGFTEYDFKHALLRDAAYSNILLKDRPLYHKAAARWLSSHSGARGEAFASQIAVHFEEAGKPEDAASYYAIAGKSAARANDPVLSLQAWNKAVLLAENAPGEVRFRYYASRERILDRLGRRDEQKRDLEILLKLADSAEEKTLHALAGAAACTRWSNYLEITSNYTEAFAWAEKAFNFCESALPRLSPNAPHYTEFLEFKSRSLYCMGRALWRQGSLDEATGYLEQAVTAARAGGFRSLESLVLRNLGAARFHAGDINAAIRLTHESLKLCRELGDESGAGAALNNLADENRFVGRYREARDLCSEALPLLERAGDAWAIVIGRTNLAVLDMYLGNLDDAMAEVLTGIEEASRIGQKSMCSLLEQLLGNIAVRKGKVNEAIPHFERALNFATEIGNPSREAETRSSLAECLMLEGKLTEAVGVLEPSLERFLAAKLEGAEEPFSAIEAALRVLRTAEDSRWKTVARAGFEALMASASRIHDEETRREFLQGIPYHARLVAANAEVSAL